LKCFQENLFNLLILKRCVGDINKFIVDPLSTANAGLINSARVHFSAPL